MWASSLVLLIGFLLAQGAHAQSDPRQTALARTLFEEGVTAADRGDWVGAVDRFGRAHALKPTSGIAFNWASALIETGQLVAAQELLLGIARDASAAPALKQESESLASRIGPRIARLRVRVPGTSRGDDAQVELDGTPWPREAWDVASPVDPGTHALVLKHGTTERARQALTLGDGEVREVVLAVDGEGTNDASALPSEATSRPRSERAPLYKSWMLWSAVGVVVVGATVTAIVLSRRDTSESESPIVGNAAPGVLRW